MCKYYRTDRLNLQRGSPEILQEAKIPIKHDSVKPNLLLVVTLLFKVTKRTLKFAYEFCQRYSFLSTSGGFICPVGV